LGKYSMDINVTSIGVDIIDNLEVQKDDTKRKNSLESFERKAFSTCWTARSFTTNPDTEAALCSICNKLKYFC
jgi:hypothetical protein